MSLISMKHSHTGFKPLVLYHCNDTCKYPTQQITFTKKIHLIGHQIYTNLKLDLDSSYCLGPMGRIVKVVCTAKLNCCL